MSGRRVEKLLGKKRETREDDEVFIIIYVVL